MLKTIAALALIAGLAACQPGKTVALNPTEGDAWIGNASSKVTVYEYGAPTCPGCKAWHDTNWAKLKADYIATNRIRFVFRETPSHNPPVDTAIFALARCIGGAAYFDVLDEAFATQGAIDRMSHEGKSHDALWTLGGKFGVDKAKVETCINDPKIIDRINAVQADAGPKGVDSTPTFFVNDTRVQDPSYANMQTMIEAALTAAGGQ
jgi:protein-disulfide isomerase